MSGGQRSCLPEGLPRPVPEPDGLSRPYWEGAGRGELWVQRCRSCRTWQWGPEWICHACLSFDIGWERVEGKGRIYSWERSWHPVHPALKDSVPYVVVLVELPDAGGIRMIGNLVGDPHQDVTIGARVEAVFEQHDEKPPPYALVHWRVKPVWGGHEVDHPNYNLPTFDPLWAAIQDADLPVTFHVSTGRDPRAARGNGGAVVNFVSHSFAPTMEPVANLCASGVLERFPRLRFATIEAGIGWLPWLLTAMDEAYLKHHFWVRPKLPKLPSEYFRLHGRASFGEDRPGLDLIEGYGLVDNVLWANDYPHHEGTWPHSAEAIERTMSRLSDTSRAKILGLNAAKFFGFRIPPGYTA